MPFLCGRNGQRSNRYGQRDRENSGAETRPQFFHSKYCPVSFPPASTNTTGHRYLWRRRLDTWFPGLNDWPINMVPLADSLELAPSCVRSFQRSKSFQPIFYILDPASTVPEQILSWKDKGKSLLATLCICNQQQCLISFYLDYQLSNLSRQISVAFILTTSTRTLVKSDITGREVGYHDLNKKAFQVLRSKITSQVHLWVASVVWMVLRMVGAKVKFCLESLVTTTQWPLPTSSFIASPLDKRNIQQIQDVLSFMMAMQYVWVRYVKLQLETNTFA